MIEINLWAVLGAAVASMLVGFVWYSPFVFGKTWEKLSDFDSQTMDKAKKNAMTLKYVLMFIGLLVMAYVMAHILLYVDARNPSEGIFTAFWMWLGFVAPVELACFIFATKAKPALLYFINNGHWLAVLIAQAVVLTTMI